VSHSPRWQNALILETGDSDAVAISRNKKLLSKYYKIVTADWSIIRQFIEKRRTYALAESCNVPHPKTFLPQTLAELYRIKNDIYYPCILKPIYSHKFQNRFHVKNFRVLDEAQLVEKFPLCLDEKQPVMIQEIIPGPDTDLFRLQGYLNSKGEMSAKFFSNKVRQNPPQFGVMRVGVSTRRNSEVEMLSERLLKQANYKGYFSIEFRKDPNDGKLKLIEMNVRMPGSSWLAIASGINFPWIIYLDLMRNQQVHVTEYKIGQYWIDLYADLFNSVFRRRREDFKFYDYLRPYLTHKKAFAILSIKDLKPFIKHRITIPELLNKIRYDSQYWKGH
jgi:predicted ATP-grasp superfamily ATP-dependent carboligase